MHNVKAADALTILHRAKFHTIVATDHPLPKPGNKTNTAMHHFRGLVLNKHFRNVSF
jgi:hypothetical protein